MEAVAQIVAERPEYAQFYNRLKAIDEEIDQRINELFIRRGYREAPKEGFRETLARDVRRIKESSSSFISRIFSWGSEPAELEGYDAAAPVIPVRKQLTEREERFITKVEALEDACAEARENADTLAGEMSQIRVEMLEMSENGQVLEYHQKKTIEKRLVACFNSFLTLSEKLSKLVVVLHKLEVSEFSHAEQGKIIALREEIEKSRCSTLKSIDRLRSEELTDWQLYQVFDKFGGGIKELVTRKELGEGWNLEQIAELDSVIMRLEGEGRISVYDLQLLLFSLTELKVRQERLESVRNDILGKACDIIKAHPTMVRTIVPSLAFGIGFLAGGPTGAFIAKVAASSAMEASLQLANRVEPSVEEQAAVAAVEAGVSALIAGPEAALSSVGASAVNASPEPVRDLALSGSLAYVARLAGVSPVTAVQVGMMGTLAIKNKSMASSIGRDLVGAVQLIVNPRGIPAAVANQAKQFFDHMVSAVRLGRWAELGTRSIVVLTPILGYTIGAMGLFLTVILAMSGSYIADKFFMEERRFEGEASLEDSHFLKYILEEYALLKEPNGFTSLSALMLDRMKALGAETEETENILAQYDQLKAVVQTDLSEVSK